MSTLTRRNTNGTVEISAQDTWTMSHFGLHRTQADCLTAGTGTRGVAKGLRPWALSPFQAQPYSMGGRL